ncbi:addiction module toxin, Txe/YoeB family [Acidithiobacillus ferrooxidans ATCC 53993]|uniref:Putative mRNA interferase YoeB n=1 Tax=Acidithiobacillus ferrooxidans (strain ATCC 23270 / DSM 14882 / CIP 104768 / NCIMB 8455) TaxID=243159 RepID=B7J4F5_ACIF2|nr:addiction module toxin, Txe/YoeB family [Acidithiobacillus ferrooxidans ATCC 53993]ACK80569.1 addiction module toxin, Txe/YoeB family [Acidithiobacillus ferrooxidans ATCC 23270]EGQ63130.1 addiction module toxin, Txe/YoeB family protein [Acidithiobacillus sp. GGI-221]
MNALVRGCLRSPHSGIGKPEPPRESLSGYWSRRIDDTHRLVYRTTTAELIIISCRHHY